MFYFGTLSKRYLQINADVLSNCKVYLVLKSARLIHFHLHHGGGRSAGATSAGFLRLCAANGAGFRRGDPGLWPPLRRAVPRCSVGAHSAALQCGVRAVVHCGLTGMLVQKITNIVNK